MNTVNQKIVDAVLQKADRLCPDSLALVGVYGSAATGDVTPFSDLDLLLLINDERGRVLGDGFLLEDSGVAYDVYCTDWNMAEGDAECRHAHLSRLLDAEILCVRDPAAAARLEALREKARGILRSDARFDRAGDALQSALSAFAECCLAGDVGSCRAWAGAAVSRVLDAVMLYHGTYFKLGVKRTFRELAALRLPFDMEGGIDRVIRAKDVPAVREALRALISETRANLPFPAHKAPPSADRLAGTWEEMYSNWRNKMTEAAENGDRFSSFMNLLSLQFMFHGIASETDVPEPSVLDRFDPEDLAENAAAFDDALTDYLKVYESVGLKPRRFADVDAFVRNYLGGEDA